MKLRYTGPFAAEIPALGVTVQPGHQFEATGADAESLIRQGVAVRVAPPRSRKPKSKPAAAPAETPKDGE